MGLPGLANGKGGAVCRGSSRVEEEMQRENQTSRLGTTNRNAQVTAEPFGSCQHAPVNADVGTAGEGVGCGRPDRPKPSGLRYGLRGGSSTGEPPIVGRIAS